MIAAIANGRNATALIEQASKSANKASGGWPALTADGSPLPKINMGITSGNTIRAIISPRCLKPVPKLAANAQKLKTAGDPVIIAVTNNKRL